MIQVEQDVFVETNYQGSNTSLICTDEGVVLIDSPFRPTDALAWREVVAQFGHTAYLINTDHHADHSFGNSFLGGTIIAHRETRSIMQSDYSGGVMPWLLDLLPVIDPGGFFDLIENKEYCPRYPSITFSDKMQLNLGKTALQLFHAPGHTYNTICVFLPDSKIMFTGDAICEAGIPSFVDGNIYDWIETLDKIESYNPEVLVTGHGKVCGSEVIGSFRAEICNVLSEVERRIDVGEARAQISAEVKYEDRIHTSVNGWTGFPDELVSYIISQSIGRVYDDIQARRATAV